MEIEKVKEIKKALEQNNAYIPFINEHYNWDEVSYADILTLINELESENKRLSGELDLQKMTDKAYKYNMACENGKQFKQISELKEKEQQLKERIAELEAMLRGE